MKKIITILFGILIVTTLSGCSVTPHIAKNTSVEKVAKECINPDVHVIGSKFQKENSGAGAYIWYQFEDARGINFRVGIDNRYISIVEPIKPFYSSHYNYLTDYKGKIIEYYEEDIINLLNNDKVKSYSIQTAYSGGINIEFKSDVELSQIAEIIMKINDMLAFDYKNNGDSDSFIASDPGARWNGYCSSDILVIVKDDVSEDSKYLTYTSFICSDNNSTNLTYDKVMLYLSVDRFVKENSESYSNPIGLFMIDDVMFYETGEVTETISKEDCTETTKLRVSGVPHNNGESNIGASVYYTRINENELVLFYKDAGRVYRVFEY